MGSSETKIVHETIDRTDPQAAQKGRQAAEQENERMVQQLEEQLRQQQAQNLADAMERVRAQNLRDANEREAEKRRMEEEENQRKMQEKLMQDRLMYEKLKGELLKYEFGNKLTLKAFDSEGIDVSDMSRVLVALFGPTGSGKTSFIGTVERTLLGKAEQTAFEQGSGGEGTVILQEYLPNLKINLLDTRGFWSIDDNTLTECLHVMTGKTRGGEVVARNEDGEHMEVDTGDMGTRRMAKFSDRVHAVVFVVQAHDQRLKEGTYLKRMQKIRDHFRFEGHSPITVITCEDELKNEGDRNLAFQQASKATGSPIDRTFFIGNYTKEKSKYSLDTEKKAANILDTVLLSAERFVKIQKLRERHHGKAETSAIQEFFKQNQAIYKWNPDRVAAIVQQLTEDLGIATVESLKESWNDVKKEVKMTIGIRTGVEEALKKINNE